MFGLERATHSENKINHVLGEDPVAFQFCGVLKAFIEHEVDVVVLGMPEDHAFFVGVLIEEFDQFLAGTEQLRHRNPASSRSAVAPEGRVPATAV